MGHVEEKRGNGGKCCKLDSNFVSTAVFIFIKRPYLPFELIYSNKVFV